MSEWAGAHPADAVFQPRQLIEVAKWKFPKLIFFDIVTTQYDHPPAVFKCFSLYLGIGCTGEGGGLPSDLLMQFFTLGGPKIEVSGITSQRLLDQIQVGVYRGKCHIPPHFGPFWAIRVPYPKGLNCEFNPLQNHSFVQ